MVEHLDACVGRVLGAAPRDAAPPSLRLLDDGDALVVFTSDHGLANGAHGLLGKQSLYEHSNGVPLIVAGAGVAAARIGATSRRAPLLTIDVMPTVLTLARVAIPAQVEGRRFDALLRGAPPDAADDGGGTASAARAARLVASRRFGVVDSVADPPGATAATWRARRYLFASMLRTQRMLYDARDGLKLVATFASGGHSLVALQLFNLGDWRQQSLVATELDADDLLLAGGGAPEREASARAFARELLVSSRSGGRSTRALGSWYAAVRRLFVTMCHEEAAINPSTSETALCFEVLNRNITSEAA